MYYSNSSEKYACSSLSPKKKGLSMPILNGVPIDPYLKEGAPVEISSNDIGFVGSWYAGTIIRLKRSSSKAVVEYKTLMDDKDKRQPLREKIDLVQLRPSPPVEERRRFDFNEYVDAYYHDGWWEGMIIRFREEDSKYVVFFKHTREQRAFKASRLRRHREWVNRNWHPPLEHQQDEGNEAYNANEEVTLSAEMHEGPVSVEMEMREVLFPAEMQEISLPAEDIPENEQIKFSYRPGQPIEVSSNEEGFEGAWFAATVLKSLTADKYLIQHQSLMSDDGKTLLTEEVDSQHIRPCPSDIAVIDRFDALEEVEAFYNDGWWEGVISRVLKDDRYMVHFRTTDEEIKFRHSQLRLHQEWINGKWVTPCTALKL